MPAQFQAATSAGFLPAPGLSRSAVLRVVTLVSQHDNVPVSLIFSAARCRLGVARARQLAMYLTHVILGESLTAVGVAFGRDRTTVSYACGLIEDMRDDPHFDAKVTALEARLEGWEN